MTDISQLFARNPLELTRDDLTTIITTMRQSRHAFNLGAKMAGSTKPPTEKQAKINSLASRISIDL